MFELIGETYRTGRTCRRTQSAKYTATEIVEMLVEHLFRLAGHSVGLHFRHNGYGPVRTTVHTHAAGYALVMVVGIVRHGQQSVETFTVLPRATVLGILQRNLWTAEVEHRHIHALAKMPQPDEYVLYIIQHFHTLTISLRQTSI